MANMYAIVYPDHKTAEQALATAQGLQEAGFLKILEQALIRRNDDGDLSVDNEKHPVRRGVTVGGIVGGVAGLFFLAPVAGAAVGAGIGTFVGKHNASGAVADFRDFRDTISEELQPGGAAVVILGETEGRDRVVHDLGRYGGTVHALDISQDELAQIQKQVDRIAGA